MAIASSEALRVLIETDARGDVMPIQKILDERDELRAENAHLRQYLEELTPGGSEFSGSPEICFQWVKQRLSMAGKVAAERNRLRQELDEARKRIKYLEKWVKEV